MSKPPESKHDAKHEEPAKEKVTLEEAPAKPTAKPKPVSLPSVEDVVRGAAPIYAALVAPWPNATEEVHQALMARAVQQVIAMHAEAEKALEEAKHPPAVPEHP